MAFAVLAAALMLDAAPAIAFDAAVTIPVTVASSIAPQPLSGRILVFAQSAQPGTAPQEKVDISFLAPTACAVAAREVRALAAGQVTTVDGEVDTFPMSFSKLPPGRYRFQAVLDRNDDYNRRGRGEGDLVSPVIEAQLPGVVPALVLNEIIQAPSPDASLAAVPDAERAGVRAALDQLVAIDFVSPRLTAFWGRPVRIRGWIGLPPGYRADGPTFPVVYTAEGFGATLASLRFSAAKAVRHMTAGDWPSMIWVFLDQSFPTGPHEFADSANNGPWGEAFVAELIPWLESRYRMDGSANGRFLTGHSSGGWTSLWLQVRYPTLFGGAWSRAPDSSDFHDFTNIDLYAPNANVYRTAAGEPIPLARHDGRVIATFEQYARMEAVLGPYGGQIAAFEWVFSPRGPDGRPLPMFDRATGRVNADVVARWREHYDIARRLERDWPHREADLNGKINVIVGTDDTFHLDAAARRLQGVLDRLGARSTFTYLPGRTHFNLLEQNGDPMGLMREITRQMFAIARPSRADSHATQ